jgi:hypothetical protein
MTNPANPQKYTMDEQHLVCPERSCGTGTLLVQRDARLPDVWHLTHATEGGAWTVAATDPVCPRCGMTLLTFLELEGGFGGSAILQPGPLLDWLRTL